MKGLQYSKIFVFRKYKTTEKNTSAKEHIYILEKRDSKHSLNLHSNRLHIRQYAYCRYQIHIYVFALHVYIFIYIHVL